MTAPIDFYFEFASPYGYFAALRIDAIAARHGRSVTWRPFMLGAIMKTTGARPLPLTPLRDRYFFHDVRRIGRAYGIEIKFAEDLPLNGLAAARAFYWLADNDDALAKRFALAVYHAHFCEGRDVGTPDAVADVAAELGVAALDLTAAIARPDIKRRLIDATQRAEERGVFGSPFFMVDGEPFFGQDRLDDVARWIDTGGW